MTDFPHLPSTPMPDNVTAEISDYGYNWTGHVLDPGGPMESPMGGPAYGPPLPPSPDIVALQAIVRGLTLYLSPILSTCGILGNALSLLGLATSPAPGPGGGRGGGGGGGGARCFGMALVAAETLQLLTLLHDWATEMGMDLYVVTGWCHLKMFLADASRFLATWYLVCLAVTCLLTTCFPERRCCSSPWCHLVITLTLAILALVVYLNICLTASLIYVSTQPVCMYMRGSGSPLVYLNHLNTFVNILIPVVVVVLGCCVLGLVKCCCGERRRETSNRGPKPQVLDYRFVVIHSALWVSFELTRLHNGISVLSTAHPKQDTQLRNFLWEQVFKFVAYLNMAINGLVLAATSGIFRKEMRRLVGVFARKLCASCACCPRKMDSKYFQCASAPAQTSIIEPMTVETI